MAFCTKVVRKILCDNLNLRIPIKNISLFRKELEESNYVIHRPQAKEYDDIIKLLWLCYYPEEPTTLGLGLGHCHNPILDEDAFGALSEGFSLVARCKFTGNIVAGSINRTVCPWDSDEMERFACTVTCPRLKSLLKFSAFILKAPNLFEKYCTDKIFEISQVFVKREERKKGLGTKLMEKSRTLGADCGFRVVRVDATSYYTSLICEKLGFQLIYSLPYENYVDIYNNPVFKTVPPHSVCNAYIDIPHSVENYNKKRQMKKK